MKRISLYVVIFSVLFAVACPGFTGGGVSAGVSNDSYSPQIYLVSSAPEDEVIIPDANFRAALLEALGKTEPYTITQGDLAGLTQLMAVYKNIASIEGMQYCTGLEHLWLCMNPVNDLTPLSGLTGLQTLWMSFSGYSDITPLQGLLNLSNVNLMGNQISDISALVNNSGIGNDDLVNLEMNRLDLSPGSAASQAVEALTARGVKVGTASQFGGYKLTVDIMGSGTVSMDPPWPAYFTGMNVTLTAAPAPGVDFSEWDGVTSSNGLTAIVAMNNDTTVTAVFSDGIQPPPNRPPVLDPIGDKTVKAGNALGFTVSAADPDGNPLAFSASNLPAGADFNMESGSFTWTPAAAGVYHGMHFEVTDGALTDFEDITITVTAPPPPPDNGDSTGGGNAGGIYTGGYFTGAIGGGASGTPTKKITSLIGSIYEDGTVFTDFEAESSDAVVGLRISKGAKCLNRVGNSPTSVSIELLTGAPSGVDAAGLAGDIYSFWPEIVTFSVPAELTFKYDTAKLPEDIKEQNMKIVWWNKAVNEWQKLESVVDTEAHTVSAQITHFSYYSVMADIAPASFTVSSLAVSPVKLARGEAANVTAVVANSGDVAGEYEAVLSVNGITSGTKSVIVEAGKSVSVNFSLSPEKAGGYTLSIGGIEAGLEVLPLPASFTLDKLAVAPETCKEGEDVTVSFVVINNGETPGTYTVDCILDGVAWESREVTVGGNSEQEVSFPLSPGAGSHDLLINNTLSAKFEVLQKPVVAAPVQDGVSQITTAPADTPPAVPAKDNGIASAVYIITGVIVMAAVIVIIMVFSIRKRKANS